MVTRSSAASLYNAEQRNPIWAPAMEDRLRARFDERSLNELGIQGISLSDVECRQSSCRVEIEWSDEIAQRLVDTGRVRPGESQLRVIIDEHGPLATFATNYAVNTPAKEGFSRAGLLLLFDENGHRPSVLLGLAAADRFQMAREQGTGARSSEQVVTALVRQKGAAMIKTVILGAVVAAASYAVSSRTFFARDGGSSGVVQQGDQARLAGRHRGVTKGLPEVERTATSGRVDVPVATCQTPQIDGIPRDMLERSAFRT